MKTNKQDERNTKTLEHQQQDLFHELSREQEEAEKALEGDQDQAAKGKQQGESDD